LLNADYFAVAVPARVAVARRALRPLSVVFIQLTEADVEPWEAAAVVLRCIRDSDTACQIDDDTIGLILEETPEDGALWTAERLRRDLDVALPSASVCVGVATYPAHALDAAELLTSASSALRSATTWPGSCIVVAQPG